MSAFPPACAVAITAALLCPASAISQRQVQSLQVRTQNTLAVERPDETIAVPWPTVRGRLTAATPTRVRVRDAAGRPVVSQVVDNDGDGTPDELLFQTSYFPLEAKLFTIEPGAPASAASRVDVQHIPERDDIAWESDRIAYRMYGQGLWKLEPLVSSGVDVWVKRVRDPIVRKWYAKGHDAYHRDTGEGADFFDVGPSLGAGGTAVWTDTGLARARNFKSWRIIANGPIRAVFELQYEPWTAGGISVSETKRVSIDAGQNLNHVVSVFRTGSTPRAVPVVIGVVKRPGMIGAESKAAPWAWLTGWGPVSPKNGGHGKLGTAVVLERVRVPEWKETADHYLALARVRPNEPVSYYVGAGWTDSGDFRDLEEWYTYLDRFAQRVAMPVSISLGAGTASAAGASAR